MLGPRLLAATGGAGEAEASFLVVPGTVQPSGMKLWLVGESATRYYYAHLEAFAPALAEGQAVDVGQTLAFVGNTGNAVRTPHHLHFEMHPEGRPAVNPYPVIAQIAEVARRQGD